MFTPARMVSALAVVLVAAGPSPAADAPEASKPLPDGVAAKWRAARAVVGWVRANPAGGGQFVRDTPRPGDLPGFRFRGLASGAEKESVFRKLADPGVPFGLSFVSALNVSGPRDLAALAGYPNLEVLDLGMCDLTDDDFKLVAAIPGLKSLTLSATGNPGHIRYTAAGLKHLRGAKSLRHLSLVATPVTDAVVTEFAGLADLRSLDLTGTDVSDVGVQDLAALPNLTALNLARTKVTDAGLADIGKIRSLEVLDLGDLRMNGRGFKHLIGLEKLHTLRLDHLGIGELSLASLAKFPALRTLTYRGRGPTADNVAAIGAVKSLRVLEVHTDLLQPDPVRLRRELAERERDDFLRPEQPERQKPPAPVVRLVARPDQVEREGLGFRGADAAEREQGERPGGRFRIVGDLQEDRGRVLRGRAEAAEVDAEMRRRVRRVPEEFGHHDRRRRADPLGRVPDRQPGVKRGGFRGRGEGRNGGRSESRERPPEFFVVDVPLQLTVVPGGRGGRRRPSRVPARGQRRRGWWRLRRGSRGPDCRAVFPGPGRRPSRRGRRPAPRPTRDC